jgi:hypothetical protein
MPRPKANALSDRIGREGRTGTGPMRTGPMRTGPSAPVAIRPVQIDRLTLTFLAT